MLNAIQWIRLAWTRYWGDGWYQYLLLAAVLYLIIFHRKKRHVRQVLIFSACLLFIFLFPLTAKCIFFCIGYTVYWRVLWLLPLIPVIALAATEFVRSRPSKVTQTILLLLCCGAIALSGKDMLSANSYIRTENRAKVPDEVAQVGNMIRAEAEKDGLSEICVMADDHIVSFLRVYDASILQGYGRALGGLMNGYCYFVFRLMREPEPLNYRRIAWMTKGSGCNFLVLHVPDDKLRKVTQFGFVKIGDVGAYSVFQLEES